MEDQDLYNRLARLAYLSGLENSNSEANIAEKQCLYDQILQERIERLRQYVKDLNDNDDI